MLKSWKTTLAGILQFVAIASDQIMLLFDGDPTTNPDYGIIVASVVTLIGLIKARDNDVSSESAGAK